MTKTNVIACIDDTSVSTAVCAYPVESNLSGNIGLGSRESLLLELAELDEKRGRLALEQGRILLETARQRALAHGVDAPIVHQRHGDLLDSLLAIEQDTRLLVLGKHDESLSAHVGSRLETLVRSLQRPMLVCPAVYRKPERVMIAFDGSDTTRKAVDMVAGSPLFRGMPCHVVLIGPDNPVHHDQLEWARQALESTGFVVTTVLRQGDVETTLLDYRREEEIDILVMGAYGHSVIRRLLVGSTTTAVIRNARVPVLLLR
jgi:nucleotide-binding universal stress UspA family protein